MIRSTTEISNDLPWSDFKLIRTNSLEFQSPLVSDDAPLEETREVVKLVEEFQVIEPFESSLSIGI